MSDAPVQAPRRIWLVSPVYFDVECHRRLRPELLAALGDKSLASLEPVFVAVDDSGGADPDMDALETSGVVVLRCPFPLGHQRAIVYGLRRLAGELRDGDLVVTLDADGEDRPVDLPRLVGPLLADPANLRRLAVAERTKRRETPWFKVLYFFFKLAFMLLTGGVIRSGNYAAFRGWWAKNLLFHPHFDLCYSSSLLSFGTPVDRVPCPRGERYAGRSKMTFLKLVMHGIRMLMPFADRIAIRGLVVFSALFFLGLALGAAVVGVRVLTELAIPGWATYTLLLALLLSGTALGCLILVFSVFVQSQSLSMSRLDVAAQKEPRVEPRAH